MNRISKKSDKKNKEEKLKKNNEESKILKDSKKGNFFNKEKSKHVILKSFEENSKKKILIIKIVLLVIFASIFVFSAVNLARWAIYNTKSSNQIKEIIKEDFVELEKQEEGKNPVDLNSLKEKNEDVVAWIRIKDTDINYPIVQAKDNDFYLHKDIEKKYSTAGWIFMDYKNHEAFIDKNTVLYGHNIKSGLMFADLQKIYKNELGTDITIEIYTEAEKLEYKVFSSYMEEPEDYATKSNIVDEGAFGKYIKEMLKRSSILYNIVPDKEGKVLTLSTCDSTGKNRILVHAVYTGGENYNKGE